MQVELWNDNDVIYVEKFKEEIIKIPAKGFVKMDRSKALSFCGTFPGCDKVTGELIVKKLRIYEDPQQRKLRLKQPMTETFVCNACGNEFLSQRELQTHCDVHHKDQLIEEKNVPRKK